MGEHINSGSSPQKRSKAGEDGRRTHRVERDVEPLSLAGRLGVLLVSPASLRASQMIQLNFTLSGNMPGALHAP